MTSGQTAFIGLDEDLEKDRSRDDLFAGTGSDDASIKEMNQVRTTVLRR
jgi:hypothetical protein